LEIITEATRSGRGQRDGSAKGFPDEVNLAASGGAGDIPEISDHLIHRPLVIFGWNRGLAKTSHVEAQHRVPR
jgi:hypothetical protein